MTYEQFKTQIYNMTGIDLSLYKERQMLRRINAIVAKYSFDDYTGYLEAIKSNKVMFEEFINYLTINVSEFYRNPEQWNILKNDILPDIISRKGHDLKIWSAACSTGDEPYSLVMTLADLMPLEKIKIHATDIDDTILQKAKAGLYNKKSLEGLPNEYVEKYFSKVGDTNYTISEKVKARVEYGKHNLLKDNYPRNFDLIVCRNVLIYFTEEAKSEIYRQFNRSLNDEGILFIGSTEQIIQCKEFGFISPKSFFYRKTRTVWMHVKHAFNLLFRESRTSFKCV